MKMKNFSSIFFCTVICAVLISGCGERKEAFVSDNSDENTALSSVLDTSQTSSAISAADTSASGSTLPGNSSGSSDNGAASSSSAASGMADSDIGQTSSSPQSSSQQSDVHNTSEEHEHQYTLTKTVEPTCAEIGYEVYKCPCGEQYAKNTDEPLGHSYTKSTVKPTCTNSGYTLNTCTRCGQERMDDHTPALGHNDGSSKTVKPTCTQRGYILHTCSRCGYEYTTAAAESAALGHDWGEWKITKKATFASEGEKQRSCSRCDETQSASIPRSKDVSGYAEEVVKIVNSERAKQGLAPLTARNDLAQYAQQRSTELVNNFAHARPDGASPLDYVMNMSGIFTAGENIAYGQSSPEAVMEAWMNSPGHRANILGSGFTMIGVGCYEENGTVYWTQIFAG